MWDRIGFAALALATLLDAAWLGSLLQDHTGADLAGASQPTAAHQLHTSTPAPSDPVPPLDDSAETETPTLAALPSGVPAGAQAVVISKHTDGDTLHLIPAQGTVLQAGVDVAVRLLEIDTPESVDPNSPVECYARKASAELARMLPIGARAWALPDRELLDRYDRILLYLWTDSGEFVNLSLVRRGFAEAVLFEPNDHYIRKMRAAERRAKSAQVGVWGACGRAGGVSRGFAGPGKSSSADPRFDYCYEANAAGYGNYVGGRDPEYDWYDDRDQDGLVCEF